MDIQRIKYFLEVARQRNFSKAATTCFVSQPSLSQQIKKLEDEVGGSLFVRARGMVRLTTLGNAFLKHAQAIMAEVSAAEEFVNQTQQNLRRTVRFGAIPTIAPYLVPEIFSWIRAEYPAARFELIENRTESVIEALLSGAIDFALLSPPTAVDSECDHLTLVRDEFLLTLPADHRLAEAESIDVGQLKKDPIILLENSHCLSQQTAAYCEKVGLEADVTIRSSQIDTLLRLVESGFGLTFTPAIAAKAHHNRKVIFRSIARNPCFRDVRLVWLKRPFLSNSQEAVLDSVRKATHRKSQPFTN